MTAEALNPDNWVFRTLQDYFAITSNTTMAEKYSRAMVDMPIEVFKKVARRITAFVNSQLERYDFRDLGQLHELEKEVAAIVDGIYCTAAGLHSFDAALLDYMTATGKPIFHWLKEHGLAVHYFSNNTFTNMAFPADLFQKFFNAAGLIYACPQNAVWFTMQKHGVPWAQFSEEYKQNVGYGRHEYNGLTKMAYDKGLSSVHLLMDAEAEDFPEFNVWGGTDGHIIMLRDQEPRLGTTYITMPCRRPVNKFEK